jgi:hypothetical protein
MARRRKAKLKSTSRKPHRSLKMRMPRVRINLRWLTAPVAALFARCDARVLRQSMVGVAWLAAVAAVVGAWVLGVPRLQAFAAHERFAGTIEVRFLDPPQWFNGDLADHLIQTAEMNLGGNPMIRDDLIACRQALLDSGWFESVKQVRRVRPDLVEIDAQFARPYTVIRDKDGDHLVDVIGRLLPLKYAIGAKTNFIAITGAHFDRPQTCGTQWEGTDVIAGIRLLHLIEQQQWMNQVTEVDVSGWVRGEPMKLRTDNGTTIVWGGAPGEEPALEVLADNKIKRLDFLFAKYGRIDAGENGGELDITNEKAVVTR